MHNWTPLEYLEGGHLCAGGETRAAVEMVNRMRQRSRQVTVDAMFHPYIRRTVKPEEFAEEREIFAILQPGKPADLDKRRSTIEQSGVCDVEAAVNCICACHDREDELHDRGRTCPCQYTPEQRRAAFEAVLDDLADTYNQPEVAAAREERERAFKKEAARLGVSIETHGGGAPYIIVGSVRGRAFYLRERGDWWTVEIAGDREPLRSPWWNGEDESIVVGEGSARELEEGEGGAEGFEITALKTAVAAVTTFLQRRECPHPGNTQWCPECGVEREKADLWRVYTT